MGFSVGSSKSKSGSEAGGPYWEDSRNQGVTYTDQNQQVNTGPWGPQADQLMAGYQLAAQQYNDAQGASDWTQKLLHQAALRSEGQLGKVQGQEGAMMGAWDRLQGQQQKATDRYDQMVDKMLGVGVGDFQEQAAQFAGQNPYLDEAVSQSWQNAQKLLGEQVGGGGGISHAASLGGNTSSSRAGVAEGVATAEMADRAQQNELALRQAAYDQGLEQANALYGGQLGLTGMIEQNAADTASLLTGQQGAQTGYQDFINQLTASVPAYMQEYEQAGWSPIQNWYDIIGSNQWGELGTRGGWSREIEDAQGHVQGETPKSRSWGTSRGSSFGISGLFG